MRDAVIYILQGWVLPNALCHYRKINNAKNTGGGGKGNPFRVSIDQPLSTCQL